MTNKNQFSNFTLPLLIAFLSGSFLLSLTQIPRFIGAIDAPETSANSARKFVPAEPPTLCPQVMYLCPNGQEVPLLPENRCQPRCPVMQPTNSPKLTSTPRTSIKPLSSLNPSKSPGANKTPVPSSFATCKPRQTPDTVCLGGMPLEIDPVTCTYRCRDYRDLSQ